MKNCWIALSGGVDSIVLTHFLTTQFSFLPLRAIHINHQLHADAKQWANHCKKICAAFQLPLEIIDISIPKKNNESIEAMARQLRYAEFRHLMQPNDLLMTAHHIDDQAETLLLQLLRGAGLRGASAMPAIQPFAPGYLIRPLLSFSRQQLMQYAKYYGLTWVEDPSNIDERFDRNFLRHSVMPLLQQRWPHAVQTLARFSKHCAKQEALLQVLAAQDNAHCGGENFQSLFIPALQQLNKTRRHNLLRYFIRQQSLPVPALRFLQEIDNTLLNAKPDANPIVRWRGAQCRRFQQQLFILPYPYQRQPQLTATELDWCQQHLPQVDLQTSNVRITFRCGGEKFKPKGSAHHRSLKNLMQTWQIPPWQRNKIPLIFVDDELVAVVGYAVK